MSPPRDVACQVLATISGRDAASIEMRHRLDELGMDSLDRVVLAVLIEEACGVELSDDALSSVRTVEDVARHVQWDGIADGRDAA